MPKHVSQTKTIPKQAKQSCGWSLAFAASPALGACAPAQGASVRDAYTDFLLSRQAMNCTPVTMTFYRFKVGKFLEWIERQGLMGPEQVAARHVRQYLAELAAADRADTTMQEG